MERLEELAGTNLGEREPWPLEDQLASVADHLDFHMTYGTVAPCTDRELGLISGAFPEGVPERVLEHTRRMDPKLQEERDRREYEARGDFLPWREHVRKVEEEHRAYAEESKRRDRALLEKNRAACGLPSMTPEQLTSWGLG